MRSSLYRSCRPGIIVVACATSIYNVFALQYRFGGYDLSPLIDAGWRVSSGQIPNRDFICTFPPIVDLAAAEAFRAFGVRWVALGITSSAICMILVLLGLRIVSVLRAVLGDKPALFLSLTYSALYLMPFLVVGHLWHSSLTEGFILYALLATYALIVVNPASRSRRVELLFHLWLAESLLLLGKPNTAIPAIFLCVAALLIARLPVWFPLLTTLFALIGDSLVLMRVHTSLISTFQVYSHLTSRFAPREFFDAVFQDPTVAGVLELLIVYSTVLPVLWLVLRVTLRRPIQLRNDPVAVLALGACVISLIGFGTNVVFKIVDAPCMLMGFALLSLKAEGDPSIADSAVKVWRGSFAYITTTLFILAVFLSATRAFMQGSSVWGYDSCGVPIVDDHQDAFFGDFHCCKPFFSILAESDVALAEHPGKSVFFGPRMEFLYARDHIASPRGLPLWWHPGSSYSTSSESDVVRAWQSDRFDRLVFLHHDRTRLPTALLTLIARDYIQLPGPSLGRLSADEEQFDAHIDLYVRRNSQDIDR